MKYSKLFLFLSLLLSGFYVLPVFALNSANFHATDTLDLPALGCSTDYANVYAYTSHATPFARLLCTGVYTPIVSETTGLTLGSFDVVDTTATCSGVTYENCALGGAGTAVWCIGEQCFPRPAFIIGLPATSEIISDASVTTMGIFGDMSPVAMIVVGIMLGLGLLVWVIARFRQKGASNA